jgi:hypothetical protein
MLRLDTFWGYEKDAPLLKLNRGYLQKNGDDLFPRVAKWPALAGVPEGSEKVVLVSVDKPDRIFVADAERTFRHDDNRAEFVKLLAHLSSSFGDYAQGLSYVASFLRLFLDDATVVPLLQHLNAQERFVPGYWKHEAIKFATDAYVFQDLITRFLPKVAEHLKKNGVDPSVYCQKWFVGLCVHVLPFEYLFPYFEGFLEGGYQYSFKWGLSLINQLQDQLLKTNDPSTLFGLLRLDSKFIAHDEEFNKLLDRVFEGVKAYDLSDIDFKSLREKIYDLHLRARVEAAHKLLNKKDDDSDDEIEDCQICKDDFPEVFCKECKLKICETCHNKPPAGSTHLRAHKVKPIEEEEEEEEEEEKESDEEKEEKEEKKADKDIGKVAESLEKLNV